MTENSLLGFACASCSNPASVVGRGPFDLADASIGMDASTSTRTAIAAHHRPAHPVRPSTGSPPQMARVATLEATRHLARKAYKAPIGPSVQCRRGISPRPFGAPIPLSDQAAV